MDAMTALPPRDCSAWVLVIGASGDLLGALQRELAILGLCPELAPTVAEGLSKMA